MKKTTLINAPLSACISELGHTDTICLCDAGLPIPLSCERIDLAVTQGTPSFFDVLKGISSELVIEKMTIANEMKKISDAGGKYPLNAGQWVDTTNPQIGALLDVLHAAAKVGEASAGQTANRSLRELFFTIGLLVFGLAISAVSLWIVIVRVTRPLSTISEILIELANGNKTVEVPYTEQIGRAHV